LEIRHSGKEGMLTGPGGGRQDMDSGDMVGYRPCKVEERTRRRVGDKITRVEREHGG